MNEINWRTGNPEKNGFYLTTRLSKFKDGKPYILFNEWRNENFPNVKHIGWQTEVLDNSETIAWASQDDIKPYKGNEIK